MSSTIEWQFLSHGDAAVLRRSVRLLVGGEADRSGQVRVGLLGASDLTVTAYIDRLLGAFTKPQPTIYANLRAGEPPGPSFIPLSRAKETGWRRRVLKLQKTYTDGLTLLDRGAAPCGFLRVEDSRQQELLWSLPLLGFRNTLLQHAIEAVYSNPAYSLGQIGGGGGAGIAASPSTMIPDDRVTDGGAVARAMADFELIVSLITDGGLGG